MTDLLKKSGKNVILSDCTEEELAKEEKCNDGYSNVFLLVVACAEGNDNVSNAADTDTVCDGVGKGHHDQSEERGNCAAEVAHINLSEVLEHKNAYVDKSRSGSSRGNDACKRRKEETDCKADGCYKACKTGSAACSNTGSAFNEGGASGGTANSACYGCNGVASHCFVDVDGVSVFVEHICFSSSAVKSTNGVKHINDAEGNDEHDCAEDTTCEFRRECVFPRLGIEYGSDADFAEILEGLRDVTQFKVGNLPCCEIVDNGSHEDADQHCALYVELGQDNDDQEAEKRNNCGCNGIPISGVNVQANELNEGVFVVGDDANVLEADESDEKTDTCGNGFFNAFGHSLCECFSCTCDGKDQEDKTGNKNKNETCAVTFDRASAGSCDLGENKGYEEEGVKSHTASLCEGELCVERVEKSTDNGSENGSDVNCIPDFIDAINTKTETNDLVRVYDDDICHCEERRKTGDDLRFYIGASLGNFEKLVHDFPPKIFILSKTVYIIFPEKSICFVHKNLKICKKIHFSLKIFRFWKNKNFLLLFC